MSRTNRTTIDDFLSQKRLAIVGLSRNTQDFSRSVFREFVRRGYDAVPVTPMASELDGKHCFAKVSEIEPPVDGVLLMTSPQTTEEVVQDCAAAGVTRVWMHRAGGAGAVSQNAVDFCRQHGMAVVAGECPLMFLPNGEWFHRFHGFLKKVTGSYPR